MKIKNKVAKKSALEEHRARIRAVLPAVRKLVADYDLPSVQAAVKTLYEERKAARELAAAEKRVAELKKKVR